MLIRRETPADAAAVGAVVGAAFATPDGGGRPVEVGLVEALRADPGWIAALSLVAVQGDVVIGHVLCTRGAVGSVPALGLAPLAVDPDHQRHGVGSALMHAVLGAAEALNEPLIALVGDGAYYARFGFRPAAELGVQAPDPAWGKHFQARALAAHEKLTGPFSYAAPVAALSARSRSGSEA